MAFHRGPKVVTDGLVLSLDAANVKSYVSGSTVWRDLSGNNYSGSLVNGPTFSSANGGNIVFDGTNDLVNLGSSNNITGNNLQTLTVGMWLKYSTTTSDLRAFTLNRGSGGLNSSLLGVYINSINDGSGVVIASVGSLGFFTRNFNNTVHLSLTFNDNYHLKNRFISVFCVINGTNRFLYIDGELKNSDSGVGMQSVSGNTDPAYVSAGPTGVNNFNGSVSNIVVYRTALSASEVQQNYNALKSRFNL